MVWMNRLLDGLNVGWTSRLKG